MLQVDIAELDLSLDRRAGVGLGETEGAIGLATKRLRLADRHGQAAAAQVGCHRGAPELDVAKRNAACRQPHVEVDAVRPPSVIGCLLHSLLVNGRNADR